MATAWVGRASGPAAEPAAGSGGLVQSAWAATRKRGSYLKAQYYRIRARRGPKKAVIAVAASMLTAAYFMLKNGVEYEDLTDSHFSKRDPAKITKHLVNRLAALGHKVTLSPPAA